MAESHGYAGSIPRVDLSSGRVAKTPTAGYAGKLLGGRGIATGIYWDEVRPGTGAFDPENRLMFMTGPLAGLPGVGGSRWVVAGKSPLTVDRIAKALKLDRERVRRIETKARSKLEKILPQNNN